MSCPCTLGSSPVTRVIRLLRLLSKTSTLSWTLDVPSRDLFSLYVSRPMISDTSSRGTQEPVPDLIGTSLTLMYTKGCLVHDTSTLTLFCDRSKRSRLFTTGSPDRSLPLWNNFDDHRSTLRGVYYEIIIFGMTATSTRDLGGVFSDFGKELFWVSPLSQTSDLP